MEHAIEEIETLIEELAESDIDNTDAGVASSFRSGTIAGLNKALEILHHQIY